MACAMKFSAGAVRNQLRHNRRTIEHSSNRDIDPERLEHDYVLSPDRGMTEYDYFLQRKSELYYYNRDDVKVMVGWISTPTICPVWMICRCFRPIVCASSRLTGILNRRSRTRI